MAVGEAFQFPDEVKTEIKPGEEPKIEITIEGEQPTQVEVVDDTPDEDKGRKPLPADFEEPTEEELAAYSEKVQARMKALTHARHDERRAKEAVQRESEETQRIARAILEENKRLKEHVNSGERVFATTLTAGAEAKLEIAKKKYKEAHEAYDADAMLAAQQELTQAQWDLNNAKNFRAPPLQAATERVYNPLTGQEPPKPDPKVLQWQQHNNWFGQDDEMTAVALIQHKQLVTSGTDPRSDEYYDKLNSHMRKRYPDFFKVPPKPEVKRPASVVASAARSSGAKSKVTLTQTQVALAKKFGLTNEQYAASVLQLERQDGR
jgi:hypothetical protein